VGTNWIAVILAHCRLRETRGSSRPNSTLYRSMISHFNSSHSGEEASYRLLRGKLAVSYRAAFSSRAVRPSNLTATCTLHSAACRIRRARVSARVWEFELSEFEIGIPGEIQPLACALCRRAEEVVLYAYPDNLSVQINLLLPLRKAQNYYPFVKMQEATRESISVTLSRFRPIGNLAIKSSVPEARN